MGLHVLARNPLGRDDAFGRRHVRELRVRRAAGAERDDVADGREPGNAGAKQIVDRDVAAIDVEAEPFGAEALRHRTAAGRDEQIVGASSSRSCRRAAAPRSRRRWRRRPPSSPSCPVWIVMPCFLNDFSSSAEIASSSTGTMRGSSSMIVTSLPKRRKIDANSTPTAPLPRMTIDFGTSRSAIASSLVMIRLRSISTPGTLRGAEPVAMMISFDAVRRLLVAFDDVDRAAAGDRRGALDPFDLVLLEEELDALGEPGHDLVLARLHLIHVDADGAFADRDAPLLDVLHHLERVRVLEQRLGRNASPDEAGAAERFLLLDDARSSARAATREWRRRSRRCPRRSRRHRTRSPCELPHRRTRTVQCGQDNSATVLASHAEWSCQASGNALQYALFSP